MSDVGGVVDCLRRFVDGVEVLGECLPAPLDSRREGTRVDVLGPLEIADHERVGIGAHRREGESAVAHHHGGDPVPARVRAERIPKHLGIHVRVTVDETGRHHATLGVHLLTTAVTDPPERGDALADDSNVGAIRAEAGAVDHHSVADHQVERHRATLRRHGRTIHRTHRAHTCWLCGGDAIGIQCDVTDLDARADAAAMITGSTLMLDGGVTA